MILKLLIEFYRWLWSLPPLDIVDTTIELAMFGAFIDIAVIIGLIGAIIIKFTDI